MWIFLNPLTLTSHFQCSSEPLWPPRDRASSSPGSSRSPHRPLSAPQDQEGVSDVTALLLWHQQDVKYPPCLGSPRDCAHTARGEMQPPAEEGGSDGSRGPHLPHGDCGWSQSHSGVQPLAQSMARVLLWTSCRVALNISEAGDPTTSLCPGPMFDPQSGKAFLCTAIGKYSWNFPRPSLWLLMLILSPSSHEIAVKSNEFFHESSLLTAEQPQVCRQGAGGEGNEGHRVQGERRWSLWPCCLDLSPSHVHPSTSSLPSCCGCSTSRMGAHFTPRAPRSGRSINH